MKVNSSILYEWFSKREPHWKLPDGREDLLELQVNDLARIVQDTKRGDKEAAEKLFKFLYRKIYRYIFYRVKMREDVEDLTQVVVLKIWKNLAKQRGNFIPWVYKISHNMVIDFYRKQSRQKELRLEEIPSDTLPGNPVPEKTVDTEGLKEALFHLTPEQAEVINLRFIQGYSSEEVSKIIRKPVGAVKALQFRALRALREYYRKKGYKVIG